MSAQVSAFLINSTPFCLVASYFVFSTCFYMVCSEQIIGALWYTYMITNTYLSVATMAEAVLSLSEAGESKRQVKKIAARDFTPGSNPWPTLDNDLPILDLVIVAYLPNERDIIKDRIHYLCTQIVYPVNRIRINCVYNTPVPIEPLETELMALEERYSQLRVFHVLGSTSKADNLNHFFTLDTGADIIAIFDADHYPHPHNPRWCAERFMADDEICIVQGRCVVYNSCDSWLTRLVAIEFDMIYAVSHPGRAMMTDFGLFCGSNGYWRAELLKTHKMHSGMLTEDIDSALRALGKNMKAVHDSNAISYELAPSELRGFWKQRLRWAQGWAQSTLVHTPMVWNLPEQGTRSFAKRFGIFSLLVVRETSSYIKTQYTCLVLSSVLLECPKTPLAFAYQLLAPMSISVWFQVISTICQFVTLIATWQMRSEFISAWMMLRFIVLYPFYFLGIGIVALYGHAREVVAYSDWNPTARR
ncbi:glycosyltransferase family 2 protein [Plenodomus tracheiphilus IPT5]|uniref:Glycosyltransferase family 2 protein n=1 Tax=Plenodomus tracheiphilus IPT5 TaxID=1408161 RepID=A0A6A7APG2_9PLEO|nr:glycosyltransferase family 2 protein [Plenodomus tracheiphilus IPT5]